MKKTEKKMIYSFDISTEKGIIEAEKKQIELYNKFDSVRVEIVGLNKINIICSN